MSTYDADVRAAQNRLAILHERTRVTGPFSAVIDGQRTGLAGCATQSSCVKPQACLRTHPLLEHLAAQPGGENCQSFIAGPGRAAQSSQDENDEEPIRHVPS